MESINDETLEYLLRKVEEATIGVGVTLCINGLIVTGVLISSTRY